MRLLLHRNLMASMAALIKACQYFELRLRDQDLQVTNGVAMGCHGVSESVMLCRGAVRLPTDGVGA